jgi:hypothetical protein
MDVFKDTLLFADAVFVTFIACFLSAGACLCICQLQKTTRAACWMAEIVLIMCGGSVWSLRQNIISEMSDIVYVGGNHSASFWHSVFK